LESKSEAKNNYTCEIQNIDNNLYINKLMNNSNYLEKEITSIKEFQVQEDELIAKLKTQKQDKSYKNGIMLKFYDGYNASASVSYAYKYYENYNPGFVEYSSGC
ncbi:TPA: hypothetical protein I9152_003022, partial [Clostridium perfringens]|nr:hypothetical protein [Clostridium perfringens]